MKSSKEEGEEDEDGEEEGGEEEEGQKGKRFIEKLRRRAVFGAVGHKSVSRRPSTPAHISVDPNNPSSSSSKIPPSSRKLAASLWEFYQYYDQDHHHHHEIPPPPAAKMHRLRHGHGKAVVRDNGLDLTDDQPESAGSIRRQISQMLTKHHQLTERNDHSSQPPSPARRRRRRAGGEANHNLKTSTELLKVLNRIWSLEEQHSDNISLIKSLKTELSHSHARIKELEEDRKLRRRAESLHRKVAMELSEVKSKMERETKSKKMLERLCDEFAKGIKSYERETHGLKKQKNWDDEEEQEEQMVLCMAESWLDERIQSGDGSKLEFEIEAFLNKSKETKKNRRSSLESVPFNALSAPIQEEEDDSNCFELKKHHREEAEKQRRRNQSLQVKFEDQMAKETSNVVVGEMIGTHRRSDEASCSYASRRAESPIRHWNPRAVTTDLGVKEKKNTLRAKLSEARTKSSRPRIRLFNG